MNTEPEIIPALQRLPLWKNCLELMRKEQVTYGQIFQAEFFEAHLRCNRNDMQFGLAISEIRRELEKDGFYLSGRGQNGNQFVILSPQSNADVMAGYQRAAADALKRGVILGTNTRLDLLKESDRRKHESILERLAVKSVLLSRSAKISKYVKQNNEKLLQ